MVGEHELKHNSFYTVDRPHTVYHTGADQARIEIEIDLKTSTVVHTSAQPQVRFVIELKRPN